MTLMTSLSHVFYGKKLVLVIFSRIKISRSHIGKIND